MPTSPAIVLPICAKVGGRADSVSATSGVSSSATTANRDSGTRGVSAGAGMLWLTMAMAGMSARASTAPEKSADTPRLTRPSASGGDTMTTARSIGPPTMSR